MSDWRNKLPMIINKVKQQLYARKYDDLERLSYVLHQHDRNGDGVFDKHVFADCCSAAGIYLTTQETTIVFQAFAVGAKMNFMDFVQSLRTAMSEYRMEVIKQAWAMLNPKGAESVPLAELFSKYHGDCHPRVKVNEKPAEEITRDFHFAMENKAVNGALNQEGWIGYYADVNAVIPNEREEFFVDTIKWTWNLALAPRTIRDSRLVELEKVLFEKVRQRTVGTDNEGLTLKRKFNYVDTYDEGLVDVKQFKMAMVELGCYFEDNELNALFQMYSNGQSRLAYNDTCAYFKDLGLQAQSNLNPSYKEYRKLPENALALIKKELKSRGFFGVSQLRKVFQRADKNGNAVLERNEFMWCLKEVGIHLTKTDYEKIFRYFDSNSNGAVDFSEFIEGLTGSISEHRKSVIKFAYDMLRQDHPTLTKEVITKHFQPVKQPEIEAGYLTKNELLREFMGLFGGAEKGIAFDEWSAVFSDISSNFGTDEAFEAYMKSLWGVA